MGFFWRLVVRSPLAFVKELLLQSVWCALGAAGGWRDGHQALLKCFNSCAPKEMQESADAWSDPFPPEHPGSVRVPGQGEAAVLPALTLLTVAVTR